MNIAFRLLLVSVFVLSTILQISSSALSVAAKHTQRPAHFLSATSADARVAFMSGSSARFDRRQRSLLQHESGSGQSSSVSGHAWLSLGSTVGGPIENFVRTIAISGTDVYVGGDFIYADGHPHGNYIARWDGNRWHPLGGGLNGRVNTIVISGTDVYVGGEFTNAGGNPIADYIARWDGSQWHAVGSSLGNSVYSVHAIALSGTDIYVGGFFFYVGEDPNAKAIVRWDGSRWHPLGSGLMGIVNDIAIRGTDVYVGGTFTDAGGNPNANYIARWDGNQWHAVGGGVNHQVDSLVISGTDLYVGGAFINAGGNPNADFIARWDGSQWHALGSGRSKRVYDIAVAGADVYVATTTEVARWNGVSWQSAGGINDECYAIAIAGIDVYVGGRFVSAGNNPYANYIARWSSGQWHSLGSKKSASINRAVEAIAVHGDDVYVGGDFKDAGGVLQATRLARWDGSQWHRLGSALDVPDGTVRTIAVDGNNNVYIGGLFRYIGNLLTTGLARWDGSQWHSEAFFNEPVFTIVFSGTNMYVGGAFSVVSGITNANGIVRRDGSQWYALGTGLHNTNSNGLASAIAISGTDVFVGGNFLNAGNASFVYNIARWDGNQWHNLGGALNDSVYALVISGTDVYVGGQFNYVWAVPDADYIARWDGSQWHSVGGRLNNAVLASVASSTGVYVGGRFTAAGGNPEANHIARWDGNQWHALSGGLNGDVYEIAITGTNVYVGGSFVDAGGNPNADYLARWSPVTLTLAVSPSITTAGQPATFTITLKDDANSPLADQFVAVSLDGQISVAYTDQNGQVVSSFTRHTTGLSSIGARVGHLSVTLPVTFLPGAPASLSLLAVPRAPRTGTPSRLIATVEDQFSNRVANGTVVNFATSFGTLSSPTATTVDGKAQVTLSSTIPGRAVVTATVGSISRSVAITYLSEVVPVSLSLSVSPTVIYANGISQTIVTAQVRDFYNDPISDVTILLASGIGTLAPLMATTDADGKVNAVLTSTLPAVDRVSAMVSDLRAERIVTYVNPSAVSAALAGALTVTKSGDATVRRGDVITCTVSVTNTGAGQLNNVLIVASIPAGTSYVPGSVQGGSFIGNDPGMLVGGGSPGLQRAQNVVSWSGNLPAGATHTLTYAVRVDALTGLIVNRPRVFLDNAETALDLMWAGEITPFSRAYAPIVER